MLRFVKSSTEPENACELYQIVDLSAVADQVAHGEMSVEASAVFNAIEDDLDTNDYVFGITVYAYSENPTKEPHVWPMRGEHPLTFGGRQTLADTDKKSWQKVTMRVVACRYEVSGDSVGGAPH